MNTIEEMIDNFRKTHTNSVLTESTINISKLSYGELMVLLHDRINSSSHDKTLKESAELKYVLNTINEEITRRNIEANTIKWPYLYSPYFVESEIVSAMNILFEHYHRDSQEHDASIHRMDPDVFRNRVKEIQSLIKNSEDPEEILRLKGELVKIGWNPEAEYTVENIIKAKERVVNMYNKEMKRNCLIIDSRGFNPTTKVFTESEKQDRSNIINMVFFEDGRIFIGLNEFPKDTSGICEIYTTIIDNANTNYEAAINEINSTLFDMPTNYKAMKIAKVLSENKAPINVIRKMYSGLYEDCNLDNIRAFYA